LTRDTELETWQREWRDQTEPLPELKKKIKRQNVRTAAAVAAIGALLAFSTTEALLHHGAFMSGLATGLWFASLLMGGYGWRVRRGSWKPAAQTTKAYVELAYKRAIAKARTLRFAFYFLLAATILYAGFVAWNWKVAFKKGLPAMVLAGMVIELFVLRYSGRRQRQDLEKTRKLAEGANEHSEVIPTER
jgi:hypothetical protein